MPASVLETDVLVLNRYSVPLGVVTARRAFELMSAEKAVVVDASQAFREWTWADWSELKPAEGEPFCPTPRLVLKLPKIIKMSGTDSLPFGKVVFNRSRLYQRDRYTCQYCGAQPGTKGLNVDHVTPVSQGGRSCWENCVIACIACNTRKADKTPEQAGMRLRKRPKKPKFTILKRDIRIKDWETYLGVAYWETELYSD